VHESSKGLLITGVFGTGKSSVAIEIAHIFESTGDSFAVLDLDWLAWFGPEDEAVYEEVLRQNLAAVVGNYLAAGVRLFVLAFAVADDAQMEVIRAAVGMPIKVVRLTVPLDEIARRLRSDVTTERKENLREAAAWLATSKGVSVEDLTVSNDRPIREVAEGILNSVGWL
jgi:chloramphenicol 3-O-phosphotransferase